MCSRLVSETAQVALERNLALCSLASKFRFPETETISAGDAVRMPTLLGRKPEHLMLPRAFRGCITTLRASALELKGACTWQRIKKLWRAYYVLDQLRRWTSFTSAKAIAVFWL